jgi:T-complex protein 1 subunit alpha
MFHLMLKVDVELDVAPPIQVDAIRQREMDITKERIEKILNSGANVVLTSKGIDDLCLK